MKRFSFPKGFIWGAATAAYQIEGAVDAEGRGLSVWDRFCEGKGNIVDGSSGREACRHFEKWREDLELLKWLHLGSYRFSIAWPRIMPRGKGSVNAKGLDFYERLVDRLLELGIKPNATLFHWDLPQALEDEGGWLNRDTAGHFADYAAVVARRLGDRLGMVATFNEPQVVVYCGYSAGVHAPGRKESKLGQNTAAHHLMLAHGLGIKALRASGSKAELGIVLAPAAVWPETPADAEAAELHWQDANDWWVHPLLLGKYPEAAWGRRGADAPALRPGDMETIGQKIGFLGLNYYTPARTRRADNAQGYEAAPAPKGAPMQSMPDWEIFPAGLENELVQFSRRYPKIPLYVAENGMSIADDAVSPDGACHDPRRLDFVRSHLIHCLRAIEQGVDLRGYYVWSLMDNFEWGLGYTQRFGITHVDYTTFKRTPKDSALWYRECAEHNGFEAQDLPLIPSHFQKAPAGA